MEALLIDGLDRKGPLTDRKLWKRIIRHYDLDEKQESEELHATRRTFDETLKSLLDSHKIMITGGSYSINKVAVTKRQRVEESQVAAQVSKKVRLNDDGSNVESTGANGTEWNYTELWKNGERHWREGTFDPEYLRINPDGYVSTLNTGLYYRLIRLSLLLILIYSITRLFCGNLNKKITEEELMAYLPGIVYIKWITDKETGEFYGSSFIEMKDPASAALAVSQDKSKFMGRPLKIYYCPPRPGDQWPPKEQPRGASGNGNKQGSSSSGNPPGRDKTPKPEGCRKLYMGNCSYDIDDDTVVDFFKDCGTMIGLRWLTRKDTGEFRVSFLYYLFEVI